MLGSLAGCGSSAEDAQLRCEGVRQERVDLFIADVDRYATQVNATPTMSCTADGELFVEATISGLSEDDLAIELDGVNVDFVELSPVACALSLSGWQLIAARTTGGLFVLSVSGQDAPIATCPP
jgi:hypothetical protein